MPRIGLVAGAGELPVIFARNAKAHGETVIVLALRGVTSEKLRDYAQKVHWFEWGDFKKALLLVVTERIRRIALLGKIDKEILFKDSKKLDEEAKNLVASPGGKADYSILKQVASAVKAVGIEIIDPTLFLEELVPVKGLLTSGKLSRAQKDDVEYGKNLARELARFDIGQTIVVKDKTVIALEAVEGTDETIKRAGSLTGGGFTVIKMARPDQDPRFDIPLVGPDTIRIIAENKGSVLALEEKKMLLMDREESVRIAGQNNISIIVV